MESLRSLWDVVTGSRRDKPVDRRTEMRLPAHGLVSIRRDFEGAEPEPVSLIGISERGFSFRAASSIPVGQRVLAEPQACAFEVFRPLEAVVRHVEPDGEDFVVGAEVVSPPAETANSAPEGPEAVQVKEDLSGRS